MITNDINQIATIATKTIELDGKTIYLNRNGSAML
jgi:hypothetical protein